MLVSVSILMAKGLDLMGLTFCQKAFALEVVRHSESLESRSLGSDPGYAV